MADIFTSALIGAGASRIASAQATRLAPSALELGSERLTRNSRRDAIGRLFSQPSSGNLFASVESFLTAAKSGSEAPPVAKIPPDNKAYNTRNAPNQNQSFQELFFQRETAAESRLRELLQATKTSSGSVSAGNAATDGGEAPPTGVPAVTRNIGLRVAEGGTATISKERLVAKDKDTSSRNLVYTVDDGPRHGRLERISNPGVAIDKFTQADIDSGAIRYVNDGGEASRDSFTFTLSDGSNETTGSFAIAVSAVNDAPEVTVNNGLTVDEGGTAAITTAQLAVFDPDSLARNTVIELVDGPASGHLELSNDPGQEITSFTREQLQQGLVRYVSDGSEVTSDSFTFTVSDGTDSSAVQTFNINVTPVDDAPEADINTGGDIDEGGVSTITAAQLNTIDVDTAPEDITYTVTSAPSNGYLQFSTDPGTAITSFTQADINAGIVQFVHDGSETTAAAFDFTASDGTTELNSDTFSFNVNPVDDAPTLSANTGITVDEGSTSAITSAQLNVTDPDTAAYDITYTVTQGPANGRLELATDPGTSITSFTQADINAGIVRYVHDGSETASDSFSFTVSDVTTSLSDTPFTVNINPVDDAPTLSANTGATVNEGGTTGITSAKLSVSDVDTAPANITYNVTSGPAHGRIESTDNPGVAITSFTQADIDAGRVQYVNDGSEFTSDSFAFTATDGTTALASSTFNLNINPVDDAPTLTANTGATLNEGGSTTITSAKLNVSDVDTAPQNITYTVTGGLANGYLELSTAPGTEITSFTQADINAGRVRYVHDGSETTSDNFTFTATDGTTALASSTFNLTVNPVDDAPTITNNGAVVVEGGATTITSARLHADDPDTSPANLVYTVTSTTNGRVERSTNPGAAITSFTQADIDAGTIRFVHDGSETTTGSFGFSLSDGTNTVSGQTFNLTATAVNDPPVVTTNTGTAVTRRTSTIITSAKLKTTDPDTAAANLTYTVTSSPRRGRLELTTNPGVRITSFTQADIDAGRVRYVHTATFGTQDDSFRFRVSDGNTTLANTTFNIDVQ